MAQIDVIIDWFKEQAENRQPISPARYLDAAQKLNVLRQDLDEETVDAEMEVNKLISDLVESGISYAGAKAKAKSVDCYKRFLSLKAKQERVIEFIRLAKKYSTLQYQDM